MFTALLEKLHRREDLSEQEAAAAMGESWTAARFVADRRASWRCR
jgi:hypothetical protein